MSRDIGWSFPPTGGGISAGFNDPGLAHFGGAREQSLARETIQNSLDAAASPGRPVDVEFELQELDGGWFHKEELSRAINACTIAAGNDEKVLRAFGEAQRLVKQPKLTFLRVADRNTTGLRGRKWRALVKELGTSWHEGAVRGVTAGGSWGIGKSAPFTVSSLRTVFYWTRFNEDDEVHELFQGKSVLMSHQFEGQERQGTGFFGQINGCEAISGALIPAEIADVEGERAPGTSLWIAGFPKETGWQKRIARRVVASFFGAIADGSLRVSLEMGSATERGDIATIEGATLKEWFEQLAQTDGKGVDGDAEEVEEARLFWDLLRTEHSAERELQGIGHCRLWIRVDDDAQLPSKVGLMRKTGMLITTEQRGLIRFPGMRRFIAICRFESEEGNALLRQMENPKHDQFEPDRIEDPNQQQRATRALRRVTDWIREEIRKQAAPQISTEPARLSELNRLLPDIQPEDPFGSEVADGGEREPSFGSASVVALKPIRRPRSGDRINVEPSGSDDWEEMRDDVDPPLPPPPVPPSPSPPSPPPSARSKRSRFPIRDPRLAPIVGGTNRYRVGFTPEATGTASIALVEAGDSAFVKRGDVVAFALNGSPLQLEAVALEEGQRMEFEITATEPIGGRAWLVSADRPATGGEQ